MREYGISVTPTYVADSNRVPIKPLQYDIPKLTRLVASMISSVATSACDIILMYLLNVSACIHVAYVRRVHTYDVIRTVPLHGGRQSSLVEIPFSDTFRRHRGTDTLALACVYTRACRALKRKGRPVRALSPEGESATFARVPYPECLYRATLRSARADGKFRPSSLSCDETNRRRRGVDTTGDREPRRGR